MSRSLAELAQINAAVAAAFDERERRPWGIEVTMVELVKQVGDLARAVLAGERYYLTDRDAAPTYSAGTERVGDELADILYCVMRIAARYGVDLEAAHVDARAREWALLRPGEPVPWTR